MLEIPNHRINTKEGEGYLCVSPTKTCLATMSSKVGTWLNWDHVRLVAIVIVLQLFFTCWCYQFKRYDYYVRAIFFAKCDFLVVLKWPTSTGKRGGGGRRNDNQVGREGQKREQMKRQHQYTTPLPLLQWCFFILLKSGEVLGYLWLYKSFMSNFCKVHKPTVQRIIVQKCGPAVNVFLYTDIHTHSIF